MCVAGDNIQAAYSVRDRPFRGTEFILIEDIRINPFRTAVPLGTDYLELTGLSPKPDWGKQLL